MSHDFSHEQIIELIHQFQHISTDKQTEENRPNSPIPPTVNELIDRLNRLRDQ